VAVMKKQAALEAGINPDDPTEGEFNDLEKLKKHVLLLDRQKKDKREKQWSNAKNLNPKNETVIKAQKAIEQVREKVLKGQKKEKVHEMKSKHRHDKLLEESQV